MKLKGYIYSGPFMGERVPQSIQNLTIRDYCVKQNAEYQLSAAEYAMPGSTLVLERLLIDMDDCDGLVFYSLFQLPRDQIKRNEVLLRVIKSKKGIHFALEGLILVDIKGYVMVNDIWSIKAELTNSWTGIYES